MFVCLWVFTSLFFPTQHAMSFCPVSGHNISLLHLGHVPVQPHKVSVNQMSSPPHSICCLVAPTSAIIMSSVRNQLSNIHVFWVRWPVISPSSTCDRVPMANYARWLSPIVSPDFWGNSAHPMTCHTGCMLWRLTKSLLNLMWLLKICPRNGYRGRCREKKAPVTPSHLSGRKTLPTHALKASLENYHICTLY